MAIKRTKKEKIIKDLQSVVAESPTIVFLQFSNVTVNETNTLRRNIDKEQVKFTVVKKTLLKKVIPQIENVDLQGEVAICYGTDELAPARVIGEQAIILKNRIKIIGGIFKGLYIDEESMKEISLIPDTKTLQSRFIGILQSPVRMLTVVVNEYAKKK